MVTWVECFVSFMSVVATYAPQRSRDLLAYMSLILRTAKRFGGHAWLNYDRAFRQEADASGLENWSMLRRTFVDGPARRSASPAKENSAARGTAADVPASSLRVTFSTSAMLTDASERIVGSIARAPKSPVPQHAASRDRHPLAPTGTITRSSPHF